MVSEVLNLVKLMPDKITKLDMVVFLLRLATASIFIVEGYLKLFVTEQNTLITYFASLGLPFPLTFGLSVGGLEFFGGILILAGFFTRLLGLLFAIEMLVATFVANLPQGFNAALEVTTLLFFITLSFGIIGAGKLSVDTYIWRK